MPIVKNVQKLYLDLNKIINVTFVIDFQIPLIYLSNKKYF